mmetsp:Transcript_21002/g.30093  ORF Transcript_21002/g.30093 Transcript_21002/m.30093 type:complete len:289 (+) Transcript_21002:657-1523(+)
MCASHSNYANNTLSSTSSSPTSNTVGQSGSSSSGQSRPLFSQNKTTSSVQPVVENYPLKSSPEDTSISSHNIRKSSGVSIIPTILVPQLQQQTNTSKSTTNKPLCCDKCDGKHLTDDCPYYKKKRDDHPDAQRGSKQKLGGFSLLPGSTILRAKVVRQPGDGSCLFHSLSYGLGSGLNASRLRNEICSFIQSNPDLKISDTPLKDWVRWDSGSSVSEYARTMARGSWGGGIEMACFSQLKNCNVHVYERSSMGFKRISAFDHPDNPQSKPVVRVLYCGGIHYDALVVN